MPHDAKKDGHTRANVAFAAMSGKDLQLRPLRFVLPEDHLMRSRILRLFRASPNISRFY